VVFEFLDKIVGPPCRWGRRFLAPLRLVRGVNWKGSVKWYVDNMGAISNFWAMPGSWQCSE
jgi:hypothetical protein